MCFMDQVLRVVSRAYVWQVELQGWMKAYVLHIHAELQLALGFVLYVQVMILGRFMSCTLNFKFSGLYMCFMCGRLNSNC